MKKYWLYIVLLLLLFSAVLYVNSTAPKDLDWRPTYAKSDKIPYGTFMLFNLLPKVFPNREIETVKDPFYTLLDEEYENQALVLINDHFDPDKYDTEKLLQFAESGNNIFIAAETFSDVFADTLGIKTETIFESLFAESKVKVNFAKDSFEGNYKFDNTLAQWSLTLDSAKRDSLGIKVLGNYFNQIPNFIEIPYGDGAIFLNSTPKAFTNYTLRDSQNWKYAFECLSYLPLQDILWDEYYKRNNIQRSELSFILSQKPLKYAYYILMCTLLLYIFFEGKRRQKIIPVVEPLKNSTVEFVDTVGRLYFQNRDHKNLALKKINHFNDFLQQKLYLKSGLPTDELLKQVQQKSSLSIEEVNKLFSKIERACHSQNYSEHELKDLNKAIDNFYKLF